MVHEGNYIAEVDIGLIDMDKGWSPCMTLEDAYKIDDVRESLRQGDIDRASRMARVFTLQPVER